MNRFTAKTLLLTCILPLLLVTADEDDYWRTVLERRQQSASAERNSAWVKEHPARESTGLIPLTDLGARTYQGQQGGLYPGGSNTVPAAHTKHGLKLVKEIGPLDGDGRRSADGRIVLRTIGMSNTQQESRTLLHLAATEHPELNPKLAIVDGA